MSAPPRPYFYAHVFLTKKLSCASDVSNCFLGYVDAPKGASTKTPKEFQIGAGGCHPEGMITPGQHPK